MFGVTALFRKHNFRQFDQQKCNNDGLKIQRVCIQFKKQNSNKNGYINRQKKRFTGRRRFLYLVHPFLITNTDNSPTVNREI